MVGCAVNESQSAPVPPTAKGPYRRSVLKAVAVWSLVTIFVGAMIVIANMNWSIDQSVISRSYTEFMTDVRADRVERITIDATTGAIAGTDKGGTSFTSRGPAGSLPDQDLADLDANGVARDYKAPSGGLGWVGSVAGMLLPVLVIAALFIWFSRRTTRGAAGAAAFGRNPGHVYTTERPSTTFADVAGYDAVKDDIREVVDFLRDPARFRDIGARIPKGILLVGRPGTGKTLMARAVAGEAGVAFISVTGSHFMEMFVGVGAARVRGLFRGGPRARPLHHLRRRDRLDRTQARPDRRGADVRRHLDRCGQRPGRSDQHRHPDGPRLGHDRSAGPGGWGGSQPPGGPAELVATRPYSEETAHMIDAEIQRVLTEQHERARQILCEHRCALDAVADALIEHETLSGDTVSRIVREAAPPVAGLRPTG